MHHIAPLIAAGWAEIIGPIVVFLFYIIGHLLSAMNNKPAQPPKRVAQPRDPAVPPQPPRTLEEKLRNEVEDFLRQVQGEKPKPARADRPTIATQRPLVVKMEPTPQTFPELEPRHESVQEHVAKHISTADITQHAATLGTEVGQADERLQSHLQERFQHQVGALEPRQKAAEPRRRRNTVAAEIAQLLRSPNGMRQVIVASEILRRPEI